LVITAARRRPGRAGVFLKSFLDEIGEGRPVDGAGSAGLIGQQGIAVRPIVTILLTGDIFYEKGWTLSQAFSQARTPERRTIFTD